MQIESPPMQGRLVSFRLSEVPPHIRKRFGRRLIELATLDGDLLEAAAITRAVERPSPKTYWIAEAAWNAVMRR